MGKIFENFNYDILQGSPPWESCQHQLTERAKTYRKKLSPRHFERSVESCPSHSEKNGIAVCISRTKNIKAGCPHPAENICFFILRRLEGKPPYRRSPTRQNIPHIFHFFVFPRKDSEGAFSFSFPKNPFAREFSFSQPLP